MEATAPGQERPCTGAYGQDFVCRDGMRVMVIGLTLRQWRNLLKVTETGQAMDALACVLHVDLNDEGARWAARAEITAIFAPWFAACTVEEFAPAFDIAGVTWSIFRSFTEAVNKDPDLSTANPMFKTVLQPGIGALFDAGIVRQSTGKTRLAS